MDTKSIAILLVLFTAGAWLFATSSSDSTLILYKQWKENLALEFTETEETYRFKVFTDNLAKINEHNSKIGKSHTEGLNQFAFLTHEEFKAQYLTTFEIPEIIAVDESEKNGPAVDWVTWGAVSPVKNQGSCTASYAFSSVAALEGLSAIVYKTQQELAAQQLVDCSQSYGNNGCYSGTMTASFQYARDRGTLIFIA